MPKHTYLASHPIIRTRPQFGNRPLLSIFAMPIAWIALFASGLASLAQAASLSVDITGLRNDQGQVIVRIFQNTKGYPKDESQALQKLVVPIHQGTASAVFHDLSPGDYALSMIHDENSNEKIDFGFLGIPKEGFGFSRNPNVLGAPDFDEAKIHLNDGDNKTVIKLRYM